MSPTQQMLEYQKELDENQMQVLFDTLTSVVF